MDRLFFHKSRLRSKRDKKINLSRWGQRDKLLIFDACDVWSEDYLHWSNFFDVKYEILVLVQIAQKTLWIFFGALWIVVLSQKQTPKNIQKVHFFQYLIILNFPKLFYLSCLMHFKRVLRVQIWHQKSSINVNSLRSKLRNKKTLIFGEGTKNGVFRYNFTDFL